MKKLIIILCLFSSVCFGQAAPTIGQVFNTITDMKSQTGQNNAIVYVIGGSTTADFRGAFYRWDNTSTATEDMTTYNVIQVTGVSTGRWIRTNQSSQILPQGVLFRIGPLKILSGSGTTNSSGEVVVNATLENTSNGTAIFSSILFNSTMSINGSATPNDVVNGTVKSVSGDLKVITYRYTKGNTIGILGAVSVVASGTGIPVQWFVVGQ